MTGIALLCHILVEGGTTAGVAALFPPFETLGRARRMVLIRKAQLHTWASFERQLFGLLATPVQQKSQDEIWGNYTHDACQASLTRTGPTEPSS